MAWVTNDSSKDCQNLSHTTGAQTIWALINLLVNGASWTAVDSYDGTSGYPSVVTGGGTGANGLDNSNAWVHLRDPGGGRELLFWRTSNHYTWNILYSLSAGYPASVAGSPPAAAADEVSVVKSVGVGLAAGAAGHRSATALFPSSGSWFAHCAVQNSAVSTVYSFWCVCIQPQSFTPKFTLICDVAVGEGDVAVAGDNDPTVWICSDDSPSRTTLCVEAGSTDGLKGYMLQGDPSEEWDYLTARHYYTTSGEVEPDECAGNNPHNMSLALNAIYAFRAASTGAVTGDKGRLFYTRFSPGSDIIKYGSRLQGASDTYIVWDAIALPGWLLSVSPRM